MKRFFFFFILVFTCSGIEGQELTHADSLLSTAIVPYKTDVGWTFKDNWGILDGFPVFDTVVMEPYGVSRVNPLIVGRNGRYGVILFSERCDTLLPLEYDSVLVSGSTIFFQTNGLWSYQYLGKDSRGGRKSQALGKIDRWFRSRHYLYFWQDGKTGIASPFAVPVLTDFPYLEPFFNLDNLSEAWIEDEKLVPFDVYLVSDGQHFGLMRTNEDLLKCKAKTIQPFNAEWCRYWETDYWKYLRYADGFEIDPHGEDVLFYSEQNWKVFHADRTRATLYLLNGTQVFDQEYEDYFLFRDGRIAVRRNGKIGVINRSGEVVVPLQFEQVDLLGHSNYRVLQDGRWYLTDFSGTVLNPQGFDFIMESKVFFGVSNQESFYEIHEKNAIGVISESGEVVLPPNYQSIDLQGDFFLLRNSEGVAVANLEGKLLSSYKYQGYKAYGSFMLLYYDKHNKDIYSVKGKLNKQLFSDYVQFDEVLKVYANNYMELLVLEEDKQTLAERQIYKGPISFQVNEWGKDTLFQKLNFGYSHSHLEEHQLSGYFGYRKDFEVAHIEAPAFREILPMHAFGYDFGIRNFEEITFSAMDSVPFISFGFIQAIYVEGAKLVGKPFLSSTIAKHARGMSSTANRLVYEADGSRSWWGTGMKGSHNANAVTEISYAGRDLVAYRLGGEYYDVQTGEGVLSNFEHYQAYNDFNTMGIAPGAIAETMDPTRGKTVKGGQWYVQIDATLNAKRINPTLINQYYFDLRMDDLDLYANDDATFISRKQEGDVLYWDYQRIDSVPLVKYREIHTASDAYYVVESADVHEGWVHPSEPDFVFDTDRTKDEFASGRILSRIGDSVYIKTVRGNALGVYNSSLQYLNNNWFSVKEVAGWRMVDRNAHMVDSLLFECVSPFQNGRALVLENGVESLVNVDLKHVFRFPAVGFSLEQNGLYMLKTASYLVLADVESGIIDTILNVEENLGNKWLFGIKNGKRYVRKIGTKKVLYVNEKPKTFGETLFWKRDGYYEMVDANGTLVVAKKSKFKNAEKSERIICFKQAKAWSFYNRQGELLLETPKGKSINELDGALVIETADSVFGLDEFGNRYALTKEGHLLGLNRSEAVFPAKSTFRVVEADGKQGIQDASGKEVLPIRFRRIVGKRNEVFVVELPSKQGLAFNYPKEILSPVYDEVIPLDDQFVWVRKGNQLAVYNVSGEWFVPFAE